MNNKGDRPGVLSADRSVTPSEPHVRRRGVIIVACLICALAILAAVVTRAVRSRSDSGRAEPVPGCDASGKSGELRLVDPNTGHDQWATSVGLITGESEPNPRPPLSTGPDVVAVHALDRSCTEFQVVVVDLADGTIKWRRGVGLKVPMFAPDVVNDQVVWRSWGDNASTAQLRSSNASDGELRWSIDDVSDAPLIVRQSTIVAILGSGLDTRVVGIDAPTGKQRWQASLPEPAASITDGDGPILVKLGNGSSIAAVDPVSGTTLWRSRLDMAPAPEPNIDAADVLVTSAPAANDRYPADQVALDRRSGAVLWRVPASGYWVLRTASDVTTSGSAPGGLEVRDIRSGRGRWRSASDHISVSTEPFITYERIEDSTLYGAAVAHTPGTGDQLWRYAPDTATSTIGGIAPTGNVVLVSLFGTGSSTQADNKVVVALSRDSGTPRWTTPRHHFRITATTSTPHGVVIADTDVLPDNI